MLWSDVLHESAYEHSFAMATKKVPFGHDGFNTRFDVAKKQY